MHDPVVKSLGIVLGTVLVKRLSADYGLEESET